MTRETAVTFSFILGIPAILGGSLLEIKEVVETGAEIDIVPLAVGFVVAAIVGFLSIKLVKIVIKNDKFKIFGIYTIILGILCIGTGTYENISGTHFYIG